jgi:hypothetical protein
MNIDLVGAFGIDEIITYNVERKKPVTSFSIYFPLWKIFPDASIKKFSPERSTIRDVLLVLNLDEKVWQEIAPVMKQYKRTVLIQFEAKKGWNLAYDKVSEFDRFVNFDQSYDYLPGFLRMNIPYDVQYASSHRDRRGIAGLKHQWSLSRKRFIDLYLLRLFPRKNRIALIATLNPTPFYGIRLEIARRFPQNLDVFGGGWPKDLPNYRGHVASKVDLLRRYKYCLVMENQRQTGYVTEKLLDCIPAGCVPLYWGAPDVHSMPGLDWVPVFDDQTTDLDQIVAENDLYHEKKGQLKKAAKEIYDTFSLDRYLSVLQKAVLNEG